MPNPRELVATLLGVRVARALHGRWQRLSTQERDRLSPLAEDVRERALDLRGAADPRSAGRGLQRANEKLADAMVDSAQADPDVAESEVIRLREELSRELERMVTAEIGASRNPPPPGAPQTWTRAGSAPTGPRR